MYTNILTNNGITKRKLLEYKNVIYVAHIFAYR